MKKPCRGCQELLPLTAFYKHPQMADGHLNYCTACVKRRVLERREKNIESERARDRERYRRFPKRREQLRQMSRKLWSDPTKAKAYRTVTNAIRDEKLIRPSQCSDCGSTCKPEAHHEDYTKPLDVTWLCRSCHCKLHRSRQLAMAASSSHPDRNQPF